MIAVSGIEAVGDLPDALNHATLFAAGVPPPAFIEFLRTPEAAAVFRAGELDPA